MAMEPYGMARASTPLRGHAAQPVRNQPMHDFTPWSAAAGGMLIGAAAALLWLGNGRIAGISGIVGALFQPRHGEFAWRAAFLTGLMLSGLVAALWYPERLGETSRSLPALSVAGLLVGVGTRIGYGCTSGHGVCGISRLSHRSIFATLVFIEAGMLTVAMARWLGAGT